jgi:lipid II:glycine glycyltransferase (peptidoglycan interpeptide bridge formation enzyme)
VLILSTSGASPTDDSDHKRAGYTRFKRSLGGQVKEYAGTWDLPIHAVRYSLYRAAKTFSNTYRSIGRSSHY